MQKSKLKIHASSFPIFAQLAFFIRQSASCIDGTSFRWPLKSSNKHSYRKVKVLSQQQNVFLRTFQEKVFGLGSAEINRPLQAALIMGVSFMFGAVIPIVPYTVLRGVSALYGSALLGGLTLFGVGAFKGYLAGKSLLLSGSEFFIVAVSAAGLGYLIGLVVQYFFPGVSVPAG